MTGYGGDHVRDNVPGPRDLQTALAGGYPPDAYVANTTAGVQQIVTTCPSGVWRVVLHCAVFPADGGCACITVTRAGVAYYISFGFGLVAGQRWTTMLNRPLALVPGEVLAGQSASAVNLARTTVAYVDVPIPPGEPL